MSSRPSSHTPVVLCRRFFLTAAAKSPDLHTPVMPSRQIWRTMARRSILFIGGSLNQTTMLHAVARELLEHECAFTPYFGDGPVRWAAACGLLDFTILAGQARRRTLVYLKAHGLALDERGARGPYHLVVTGSDLIVPADLGGRPLLLVQEGMTDPEDWRYHLVRRLRLPRWLANTSMTGLSHAYARFCVASEGYRELFIGKGVRPERLVVTGLPNFDDAARHLENDFPHRGYVLGATSCLRETGKPEDRRGFIRKTLRVADGRPVIFKLHPNECVDRARREIEREAPQSLVFAEGNVHHLVANCEALVAKYSSVVYLAAALGKELHCDLAPEVVGRLLPVQNGGRSAAHIAAVCREVLA